MIIHRITPTPCIYRYNRFELHLEAVALLDNGFVELDWGGGLKTRVERRFVEFLEAVQLVLLESC